MAAIVTHHAAHMGRACQTRLLDLARGFETADHDHVWAMARRYRLRPNIVRLLLATYRRDRRISVDAGFGRPVCARRTIIAGCSCVTTLLPLCLIDD